MLCSSLKLLTIFDACYVLNLDQRPDKWAHVQKQIQRAQLIKFCKGNVEIERVSGINGNTLNMHDLHKKGVITDIGYERFNLALEEKLFGMDLTCGAIGCALSHRAIWNKIVAGKQSCALVLEDDVEFHHKFARQLLERWAAIPSDWGVVYLGGLDLLSRGKPPRPLIAPCLRRAYQGHRELTAYVLHHASAQRCLELTLPLTWQIDTHICSKLQYDVAAEDQYICDPISYVFQPSLAMQVTSFGTDVQKSPSANPALEDATRRLREFVAGETSIREKPEEKEPYNRND